MNRHPLALLTGWDMVLFILWMIVSGAVVAGAVLIAGCAGVLADADRFDPEENTLWTLINDHRQENGLPPLGLNDQLTDAAEWMSEDMAAKDYFSHTDSLGRSPEQRMVDFGYFVLKTTTGENLIAGMDTAQAAFDAWESSPEHKDNMLNPAFWAIGIARAYDEDSAYGWYWTVDFGGRGPAWFPPTPTPAPSPFPIATPVPSAVVGGEEPTPTPTLTLTTAPVPVAIPAPTPTAAPVPAELPSTGTKP